MAKQRQGVTYYTVTELADKLNVHRNSVIYWIKSNKIEATRMGLSPKSPYMIAEHEAERVVEELASPE